MARVSVIIPAYNPGDYLRQALRSVLQQTFADWELVVVDDGSSEDLSGMAKEYPQARFIRTARGGPGQARNIGISNTTAEYIAMLDSDDVWMSNKLELQVQFMDAARECALCHTDFEFIDSSGTKLVGAGKVSHLTSYLELLKGPNVLTSSVLMRRSCLWQSGLHNPQFRVAQDYDLFLRVALSNKISHLPVSTTCYRILERSNSRNYELMLTSLGLIYDKHLGLSRQNGRQGVKEAITIGWRRFRKDLGRSAFDDGRAALRNGHGNQFLRHLGRAFSLNPLFVTESIILWIRLRLPGKRHRQRCSSG